MFSSHNSSHNSRNNSRPASRNNSRPPSTEPEPNPAREYEEMYLYDETTETNKQGFKGILPVTKNELFKFQDTVSKNIESLQLENKEQISLVQANILYDQKTSNENSKQEILDIVNKNYLNIMEVVSKSFEDNKSNIQTLLEGLPLIITNIIESKEVSPQDKEKMTTDPIPEPIPEQHKQPGINEDDNKSFRYNLKVKQLIRDGIVTEHEAITHPAYVKSFIPNYRNGNRSRSVSPQPRYTGYNQESIKKAWTPETRDSKVFLDREGIQEMVKEERSNFQHTQFVKTTCNLAEGYGSEPRLGEVSKIVKRLKTLNLHPVSVLGLHQFLEQFPKREFEHLNQREFNLVLHSFIGEELSTKCGRNRILPHTMTTSAFINELHNLHTDCISELQVEEQLATYQPKSANISLVWQELNNIIDQMDSNTWPEIYKTKKLYHALYSKAMPDHLQSMLQNLQTYNYVTRERETPTRAALRVFTMQNATVINKHLSTIARKTKIHLVEEVDTVIVPETVASPAKAPSGFQQFQATPQNPPYQGNQQYDNRQNRNYNGYNSNGNRYKQQDNQQGFRDTYRRQPDYNRRPPFNGIQCTNCGKIGHMLEKCFFHPDATLALINRRERNIMCLLCGNREHTCEHCPTYPGIQPVKDRCPQCKLKNIILYHPNDRCSKN
jgi:hypothetical protein